MPANNFVAGMARSYTRADSNANIKIVARFRAHQGLNISTPVGSKSATFRVTTVIPCTSAVAAISASRCGRGSGTFSLAQRCATAISTARIRPSNAGNT